MSLEKMTDEELSEYQHRMTKLGYGSESKLSLVALIVGLVFVGGTLLNLINYMSWFDIISLAMGGAALFYTNSREQSRRYYQELSQEAILEMQRRR